MLFLLLLAAQIQLLHLRLVDLYTEQALLTPLLPPEPLVKCLHQTEPLPLHGQPLPQVQQLGLSELYQLTAFFAKEQ
jgi:hypothetical protein